MDYVIDLYKELDEEYFKDVAVKIQKKESKVIDFNKAKRNKNIREKMSSLYGGVR